MADELGRAGVNVGEISHDVPDSDGTRPKRTNGPALLVRLDADLHARFAICCEANGFTMAEIVRTAIASYVENDESWRTADA